MNHPVIVASCPIEDSFTTGGYEFRFRLQSTAVGSSNFPASYNLGSTVSLKDVPPRGYAPLPHPHMSDVVLSGGGLKGVE